MSASRPPILARIEAAFEPHLKSPDEIFDIRSRIANYLDSLAPQNDATLSDLDAFVIPKHVTGVRRRYLRAHRDNLKAKLEYAQLREKVGYRITLNADANDPTRTLQIHCELIRLRKQHQKYKILSHHLAKVEALADKQQLLNRHPTYDTDINITATNQADPIDTSRDSSRAQELNRHLKVAVIQANHQLNRERQLLETAQSHAPDADGASSEAKLHSLLSTKAELTTWIEASLAKCDVSVLEDGIQAFDQTSPRDPNELTRTIEVQYEKYIQARSQLLDVASAVMTPLPTATPGNPSTVQPVTARPQSTTPTTSLRPPTSILPYLDSRHLPLLQQSTALSQSQSHLDRLMSKHSQNLHEQLLRLNDESHLLPSYPILKPPTQDVDEIEKLLRAWKFAMEAAGTATVAGVEKQIAVGGRAIEEADAVLEGQDEISEIWKKLELA